MNISNSIPASLPLPSIATDELASAAKSTQREMEKIGEDFESIFVSLMLKEMRNTISSEDGGGMFAGEGSDTYGGLFDMFLGQHIAGSKPLGIGQAIEQYLSNQP